MAELKPLPQVAIADISPMWRLALGGHDGLLRQALAVRETRAASWALAGALVGLAIREPAPPRAHLCGAEGLLDYGERAIDAYEGVYDLDQVLLAGAALMREASGVQAEEVEAARKNFEGAASPA